MAKTKTTKRKTVQPVDKPYSCHCGTRFIRRTYLNVHIKKFHNDEVVPPKVPETKSETPKVPETKSVPPKIPELKSNVSPNVKPSTSKAFTLDDLSSPDCEVLEPYDIDSDSDNMDCSSGGSSDSKKSDNEEVVDNEMELNRGKEEKRNEEVVDTEIELNHGKEEMGKEDIRKVKELYLGRIHCKPTRPMKPLAPVKRFQEKPVEEEAIDEIIINLKDDMKKRIVFKLPSEKKLQMDLNFK